MDTMLTYNTNSKTGPVCGGRAKIINGFLVLVDIFSQTLNPIKKILKMLSV